MAHLGGIVAAVGLIAAAVGTVVGSKVAVYFLMRTHERFEEAVWKEIREDRKETQDLGKTVAGIKAVCDERSRKGGCI